MTLFRRFRRTDADDVEIDGGDGRYYMSGCLERSNPVGALVPLATRDDVPLLPEAQWVQQESLRYLETWQRDINQNGYPACCLASLAHAMQYTMARDGRPALDLDWQRAWRKLSGGRGGVALDDACRFAMDTGFPLADGSQGGVVKIAEAWDCDSIEGFASGLQRGCFGTFGHDVHAECATRLTKQNGVWYVDTRNSWGRDWGDKGWHLFPLRNIELRTYGAILIRELALVPGDLAGYPDA
jgi:hypothetical protein